MAFQASILAQDMVTEEEIPYTIGQELGRGAHSHVYLATPKEGDAERTEVAMKVIRKAGLKPKIQLRLKREVDVHSSLDHPNIVGIVETFETADKVFIALEHMRGGELFDRILQKKSFPESEAIDLMRKIVDAVAYMHRNGIAHRDLKPENLLYESEADDAEIKIADFGLAKREDDQGDLKTPCGTPGYIAPEIAKLRTYNRSVDMWSLGVVLYTLLCGFPPFYHKNTRRLLEQVKRGKFKFPSPYWDNVSEEAKDLVSSLLTLSPDDRLDAQQCLDHPWLRLAAEYVDLPSPSLASPSNLALFSARSAREGVPAMNMAVALAIEAARKEGEVPEVTVDLSMSKLRQRRRQNRESSASGEEASTSSPAEGFPEIIPVDVETSDEIVPIEVAAGGEGASTAAAASPAPADAASAVDGAGDTAGDTAVDDTADDTAEATTAATEDADAASGTGEGNNDGATVSASAEPTPPTDGATSS